MGAEYKLFVKIGRKFKPISGILAGENLKPLIKVKLDTAIKKYIKTCTSQKCVKNQNNEQFDFNRMMIFMKSRGKHYVSDLTLDDFENLENHYLKIMKYTSSLRRFGSYSHFLNKCVEWEYIHRNPLSKIKKRKFEKNHFKVWSKSDYKKVLSRSSGVFKNMLQFSWMTGCRPIEARNLKWSDIDFNNRVIVLKCGKNADISRHFPMNDNLCNFLHRIGMSGNTVFNINGREISNDNFYQYISHRLKILKIKSLAPYGLRHTFATRLSNAGVSAFHIQFLLGHKDIRTTLRYVHQEKKALISSLNKIS